MKEKENFTHTEYVNFMHTWNIYFSTSVGFLWFDITEKKKKDNYVHF